jgi:hypothetical protein
MTAKFIKLTEVGKNNKASRPLLLNVNHINSIKQSDTGPDTHVHMIPNHYFFVKETLAEVEVML